MTSVSQESEANQTTIEVEGPGLPVPWVYYKDEKYVFNRLIPKEEINMTMIELADTKTNEGDGVELGQDIYLYKVDGSLFVVSNNGTEEEWANFIKD